MIYTLTCNPSLDYIVTVKNFTIGGMNRTENERILPGGKGINVSIVLKKSGCFEHDTRIYCRIYRGRDSKENQGGRVYGRINIGRPGMVPH